MALGLKNITRNMIPTLFKDKIRRRILSNTPAATYWQMIDPQFTLRSGVSIRVKSDSDWWVYNEIFVDREYDPPIKMALESAAPDRAFNVLDIGANVGFFTLRVFDLIHQAGLSGLVPQVTMVEGSPAVFKELELRIASQSLAPDSVRTVHGLIGNRSGSARIYESDFEAKNTTVGGQNLPGVSVDYIDLNSLYDREAEIDLLKCDIEGSELMFLENYQDLMRQTKLAVFELHHDKCDTDKCLRLLENAGFKKNKTLSSIGATSTHVFWN